MKCKNLRPTSFYRATLCCCPVYVCLSVSPSVRPPVTFVYCIQTAEDIVKLHSEPGSPITLVFFYSEGRTKFKGEPRQRGALNTRGGKILRLSTEIAVYLRDGTVQIHGYYGTLIYEVKDGGSIRVGFSDLE